MRLHLDALFVAAVFLVAILTLPAASDTAGLEDFRRPSEIPFPENAPYSPQIAAIGKLLFFDPRISGAQNQSCSSCHNPSFGWEAPVPRAIGAQGAELERHAPTVENLAEAAHFMWDGRVTSLEEQARGPITRPEEMNSSLRQVVQRLRRVPKYRRDFRIAFPGQGLNEDTVLRALATYQRTLRSGWAPFDDWVAGDEVAVSAAAKRGFAFFIGAGGCAACHSGWAFTDHALHDIGLAPEAPLPKDSSSTALPNQTSFKTPGLRNIALRAPYMHDGSLRDLVAVLAHYRKGGHHHDDRAVEIVPVNITLNVELELIAFLETLTAHDANVSHPTLPAH